MGIKTRRLIITSLFIVSFASLAYQVLWLRLLLKIFGSSVYAVSTLLTSFMAGLALGSFLGGIYVDKSDEPLRFYSWLLISIGIFGAITSYGFALLTAFSVLLFNTFHESFIFHEIQFILTFLVMIIPTSLIGAVFPVTTKVLAEKEVASDIGVIRVLVEKEVASDIGVIYSASNVASAAGSVITGFIFLSLFGVSTTLLIISSAVTGSGLFLLYITERG